MKEKDGVRGLLADMASLEDCQGMGQAGTEQLPGDLSSGCRNSIDGSNSDN